MNPKYPIYIVSKGRSESRHTAAALDLMNVPYQVVIEEQEYDLYRKYQTEEQLLVLPQKYKDEYITNDDLGLSRSTGPGPARNFAWDTALELGYKRHWVMDDNMCRFQRLNHNWRTTVTSGTILRCAEDFVDRYSNVPVSGLNYSKFAIPEDKRPPYILNTRIYSCLLIENDIDYRWESRYNEDTDLSLRVLKDGLCTVQFNAFLADKLTTQVVRGGNSKEFYDHEGTDPKSQMIEDLHPDVAKVVYRHNRIHHHVDYSPFNDNQLKRIVNVKPGINNYGMELIRTDNPNDNSIK